MAKRPKNIYEARVTSRNSGLTEAQISEYLPLVETIWWATEDGAITEAEYVQWVFKAFMAVKNNTMASFTPEFEAKFGRIETTDFDIEAFDVEIEDDFTPTTNTPGGVLPPASFTPPGVEKETLKDFFEKYKTIIIGLLAMAVLIGIYYATQKKSK